ncbi:interleukin-5 receptor subunit alpha-like [Leptodactylus fuscus]|uniref:interleukin-5 receptor subunit alpha-like n=1 Tax=Leptodactylus fuscus TaxID=238119 RepID=UPI003F4E6985
MRIRILLIFIWQCVPFHLCCNLHGLEYDLEVKNLSLRIRNKEAFLIWECDFPIEKFSHISYRIFLNSEFEADEQVCGEEVAIILQNDFPVPVCAQVVPVVNNEECGNKSKICLKPEHVTGRNKTAENIQCIIYNATMKCTWTFGKNVPDKMEYTLSVMQDTTIMNCQQYVYDLENRTGSCFFHNLTIHYFQAVTVILNIKGSEGHVIRDQFTPAEKEIFNPPTNLKVNYSKEYAILSWKRPYTHYTVPESCFQYQMEKNKELTSDISNTYFILSLEKKNVIRVRAKGEHICGMNTEWGQWSEAISCDAPQEKSDKNEFVILISFLVLALFIITFTIIISIHYKRICKFLFPRIPEPKNYFFEIQEYETNTVSM